MKYEGVVYRPPSEAYSLIVQATIGCSHNSCTFCSMYKDKTYRIKPVDEIIEELKAARYKYGDVRRIFLADGNALSINTEDLKKILQEIKILFPNCERVGIYGAPGDINKKTVEELIELKKLGLLIVYLGIESGSDIILERIKKGVTSDQIIEAGKKVVSSGIKLSITLISGLGGKEYWREHAIESSKVVNAINPDYIGLLTLLLQKNTLMYKEVERGDIKLLTPREVLIETYELVKNLKLSHCVFRSNHASNYVSLAATLPHEKNKLLAQIEEALENNFDFKDEFFRRL